MKKPLILVLVTLFSGLLFVQCKSKEDKANELIKDYMFKNLYDFESYQPIETKIDSAFHTIYNDSTARIYALTMMLSEERCDELASKYDMIQSSIDIWCEGGSYYSSYSNKKCLECLDEAKDNLREQFFWKLKIEDYRDSIVDLSKTLNNEFIGWQVTHDFRCKTKGGNPDIGHYVFIMDKGLKTIITKKDIDKDNETKVRKTIDESLEMTDEQRAEIREKYQGLISRINGE